MLQQFHMAKKTLQHKQLHELSSKFSCTIYMADGVNFCLEISSDDWRGAILNSDNTTKILKNYQITDRNFSKQVPVRKDSLIGTHSKFMKDKI